MGKPQNAFLAKLQAQAQKKEAVKTEAHVEIDTIAMLLAAHDVCGVGKGRAGKLLNSYLAWKLEIAEKVVKEVNEDKSKQREVLVIRRDLAVSLKRILGPEEWEKSKTLFPFLRDFWEVER